MAPRGTHIPRGRWQGPGGNVYGPAGTSVDSSLSWSRDGRGPQAARLHVGGRVSPCVSVGDPRQWQRLPLPQPKDKEPDQGGWQGCREGQGCPEGSPPVTGHAGPAGPWWGAGAANLPHRPGSRPSAAPPETVGGTLAAHASICPRLFAPGVPCAGSFAPLPPTRMSAAGRGASCQFTVGSSEPSAQGVPSKYLWDLPGSAPSMARQWGQEHPSHRPGLEDQRQQTSWTSAPKCHPCRPRPPALTSRAGDRYSPIGSSPWPPPWLPGSLLCGWGLCRPCQPSSRTWTLAELGRGPRVLSIHMQPAGTGRGTSLRPSSHQQAAQP